MEVLPMKWKLEWLQKICALCEEYKQLEGLQDAKRASEIPDEILAIAEKEIMKF